MPEPETSPLQGLPAYLLDGDSGEVPPEFLAGRRWPIWAARLALLATLLLIAPVLWRELNTASGRGTLLMVGFAAVLVSAMFLIWSHETINKERRTPRTRAMRAALTLGASCVSVALFLRGTQADAEHAHGKVAPVHRPLLPDLEGPHGLAIHPQHACLLPRFSQRMTGANQAPISLIFLGSGTELLQTFAAAGWHTAERITPRTALRAFGRGVMNRPYHRAPVFPSFLEGKLHDIAFQTTDAGSSSRRRHHARWWLTDFTCHGKQVWVATASYDAGVGVGRLFPMPIHHIDPDIDAERDYIARSLTGTRLVKVTQKLRVTEPMAGRNAAGDRFYTRGVAFVLA